MSNRFPVFDYLGRKVGEFIPVGGGEGCGMLVAALAFFLFYCMPVVNFVAPPILFVLAITRRPSFPYRKLWVGITSVLLALWVVGICAGIGVLIFRQVHQQSVQNEVSWAKSNPDQAFTITVTNPNSFTVKSNLKQIVTFSSPDLSMLCTVNPNDPTAYANNPVLAWGKSVPVRCDYIPPSGVSLTIWSDEIPWTKVGEYCVKPAGEVSAGECP